MYVIKHYNMYYVFNKALYYKMNIRFKKNIFQINKI